ncbi:MAG: hypothetical protein M1169_09390 [Firmicutes bacterium]|nr:hypothetical protein [Bacillota bacterium]
MMMFFIFLHEIGHFIIGKLLGFPVSGIEIGRFPYRLFRIGKFIVRIGAFPWFGRTLLGGGKVKTFSPFRQFLFASGGLIFEMAFFSILWLFFQSLIFRILLGLIFIDQALVNFIPHYEKDRAMNDGALLYDLFFHKKGIYPVQGF